MNELRLKWFNLEPFKPDDVKAFFDLAQSQQFDNNKPLGYIIDSRQQHALRGRFIEREIAVEHIRDPFGEMEIIKRVVYHTTTFILRESQPQLELINYPRRLSKFLLKFGEIYSFRMAVNPATCDVLEWAKSISKCLTSSDIRFIEAINVGIARDTVAKISFTGIENMQQGAIQFLTGRSHKIVRVGLSGIFNGENYKCSLTAEGQCTLIGEVPTDLSDTIRERLVTPAL